MAAAGAISLTRSGFHRELARLQDEVLVLGAMVDKALSGSVSALCAHDTDRARRLEAEDVLINRKRFDIEEAALLQIATQQPMASDLRRLAAIIHIVTDLERMGDYAAGIAHICVEIGDEPHVKPLVDIPRMSDKARSMLRRSLECLVQCDPMTAEAIAAEDDEVDQLYTQVYRELLAIMLADPRTIDAATRLLWAAHNLERVADRAQNICERAIFVVTGRMRELSRGAVSVF